MLRYKPRVVTQNIPQVVHDPWLKRLEWLFNATHLSVKTVRGYVTGQSPKWIFIRLWFKLFFLSTYIYNIFRGAIHFLVMFGPGKQGWLATVGVVFHKLGLPGAAFQGIFVPTSIGDIYQSVTMSQAESRGQVWFLRDVHSASYGEGDGDGFWTTMTKGNIRLMLTYVKRLVWYIVGTLFGAASAVQLLLVMIIYKEVMAGDGMFAIFLPSFGPTCLCLIFYFFGVLGLLTMQSYVFLMSKFFELKFGQLHQQLNFIKRQIHWRSTRPLIYTVPFTYTELVNRIVRYNVFASVEITRMDDVAALTVSSCAIFLLFGTLDDLFLGVMTTQMTVIVFMDSAYFAFIGSRVNSSAMKCYSALNSLQRSLLQKSNTRAVRKQIANCIEHLGARNKPVGFTIGTQWAYTKMEFAHFIISIIQIVLLLADLLRSASLVKL